ncbi:tetratricopeptide (TPR) repeat protein [Elusimicrobium simillimum]|uniref:tetratricopeptide repeat protein n=1 Tax=Elusimicrobium simillimum TaxID=3143438 RepID=UPI003C6FD455
MERKKPLIRGWFIIALVLAAVALVHYKVVSPCKDGQSCNLICYENLGKQNYEKAEKYCKLAIKKDPKFTWPYNNMCSIKTSQGKMTEAMEYCQKAIEINPNYVNAYTNLGNAREHLGDHRGAIESYNLALDIDPKDQNALFNIGAAKSNSGDFDGAVAAFENLAQIAPKYRNLYRSMGKALYYSGDYAGAIISFNKELELYPNHTGAATDLANVFMAGGDFEEACEIYKKYTKYPCDFPNYMAKREGELHKEIEENNKKYLPLGLPYFELADLKFRINDFSGVIKNLDEALKITRNHEYYNNRAWAKVKMGHFKAALKDGLIAIQLAPADDNIGHIYDTVAVANYGMGDYNTALTYHDKALAANPGDAEILKARAATRAAMGNYDGAQADISKINDMRSSAQRGHKQRRQQDFALFLRKLFTGF